MSLKEDIEENFKVGLLDLLILKLLSKEDMYGYQIKQEIYSSSKEKIEIKEGSLYGPFYRLEKKNFGETKEIINSFEGQIDYYKKLAKKRLIVIIAIIIIVSFSYFVYRF